MLKTIGIILLVIIALTAITLVRNAKEQEKQQALMVKSDEDLIGQHFYMPRENAEDVDINLYLINDGQKHSVISLRLCAGCCPALTGQLPLLSFDHLRVRCCCSSLSQDRI